MYVYIASPGTSKKTDMAQTAKTHRNIAKPKKL